MNSMVHIFDLSDFHYDKVGRTLSQDASILDHRASKSALMKSGGVNRPMYQWIKPLYLTATSCEKGFAIKSEQTDRIVRFTLNDEDEHKLCFLPVNGQADCGVDEVIVWKT